MQTDMLPAKSVAKAAVRRLQTVRDREPNPLNASPKLIKGYIHELQRADLALAHAEDAAVAGNLSEVEQAVIRRRRISVDVAIARQLDIAARHMSANRAEAIATLDSIFKLGTVPEQPMSGRYTGELLTSTVWGPLDSWGRMLALVWMPWKGKRFDESTSSGVNYLAPGDRNVARVVWPGYTDWQRDNKSGLYIGLHFETSTGAGVADPDLQVLRLNYDLPVNPNFLVRSVLDELVQISGGYFLGKAYLRGKKGYTLAAFFALRKLSTD